MPNFIQNSLWLCFLNNLRLRMRSIIKLARFPTFCMYHLLLNKLLYLSVL